MALGSREVVRRAIEFRAPDRVPIDWYTDRSVSDCDRVAYGKAPGWEPKHPRENEWGYRWENVPGDDKTMGQVTGHPLEDWAKLGEWRAPPLALEARFAGLRESVLLKQERFVWGAMGHLLFEKLHFLRGMTNLFEDLFCERERIERLADQIVEFHVAMVKMYALVGADGISFADDWGTQERLLVSPSLFRDFFKPRYRRIFQAARQRGLHVYFHCCGQIRDIVGDLAEVGVTVLELDQPNLTGVDWLRDNFGGTLCFCCPVDIQSTFGRGLDAVEREARHLMVALGSYDGGYIARQYPQPWAIDIPDDEVAHSLKVFQRYGRYPLEAEPD